MVVIAGLEEGLFPHSRSREDEAELEEERRLCYVGITRARKQLVLTSAARRRVFGEYQNTEPSRFIDEIPPDLIEQEFPSSRHRSVGRARRQAAGSYAPNPYGARAEAAPGSRAAKVPTPNFITRKRISRRGPDARRAGAARAVRPRNGGQRRGSGRRPEAGRAVQLGGTKTLRAKYAKLERA